MLLPKSELLVYLEHTDGIKGCLFMCLSNNTLYTSATALFDETLFPKCDKSKPKGMTHLNEPRHQNPSEATQNTTPGDFNGLPSFKTKREVPVPNRAQEAPL